MPPLLVELVVGVAAALLFVAVRVALIPFVGDRSPYAFAFLGVVSAGVFAGWRSGLVALVVGQALTWTFVVGHGFDQVPAESALVGGLVVSTVSQLLILLVVALYQREVQKARTEQDRQMDLLGEALREIDHRTRNNYQTIVALILLQAQRASAPDVRKALAEAADRVRAVSLASHQLALRSEDLGTVRLGEHLRELCSQIKRGLAGDEVVLRCDFADITARADTAIHLSIVVNELVTNALKHAFDGKNGGEIRVSCAPDGDGLELVIADNGRGMKSAAVRRQGLGTRLVERFVKELQARHDVISSDNGTTHRIRLAKAT